MKTKGIILLMLMVCCLSGCELLSKTHTHHEHEEVPDFIPREVTNEQIR